MKMNEQAEIDHKTAEWVLQEIDETGPVNVNWNMKERWITAIIRGIKKAREAEKDE